MNAVIGAPHSAQKTDAWLNAQKDGQVRLRLEEEEGERRSASLRLSAPLSEAISTSEPMQGPSMEQPPQHMMPLRLGLEETAISPSSAHAMTFNVRAALELMWDDVHDLEERVERITRQAHVGMLVAHVKANSRRKK
ncbi:Uncharacterised protein [uncultured archaeon]|nr:Uncharacterised protein [uncultured archaeon]